MAHITPLRACTPMSGAHDHGPWQPDRAAASDSMKYVTEPCRRIELRVPASLFDILEQELGRWAQRHRETLVFGFAKRLDSRLGTTYVLNTLFTSDDESVRRDGHRAEAGQDALAALFATYIRGGFSDTGHAIVFLHAHWFSHGAVSMSGVDWAGMRQAQQRYADRLPGRESLHIVFNGDTSMFEGWLVPSAGGPVEIARLSIVGKGAHVLHAGRRKPTMPAEQRGRYDRQLLIPGLDLDLAAGADVGIVGLGGLGHKYVQELVALGIGANATVVLCDGDDVDHSNLSRFPHARPSDVGTPKVDVSARFLRELGHGREIIPLHMSCFEPEAQRALGACQLLINGVDDDFARYVMTHVASRFMVPMVDCGAGVLIDNLAGRRIVCPGGTIRTYVPGASSCLLCNGGLDFAAIDHQVAQLAADGDEEERELLVRTGYLTDGAGEGAPAPSVGNLNSVVAGIGMGKALGLLLGAPGGETTHLDLAAMSLITEKGKSHPECRFCGDRAHGGATELATGRVLALDELRTKLRRGDQMPPIDEQE